MGERSKEQIRAELLDKQRKRVISDLYHATWGLYSDFTREHPYDDSERLELVDQFRDRLVGQIEKLLAVENFFEEGLRLKCQQALQGLKAEVYKGDLFDECHRLLNAILDYYDLQVRQGAITIKYGLPE